MYCTGRKFSSVGELGEVLTNIKQDQRNDGERVRIDYKLQKGLLTTGSSYTPVSVGVANSTVVLKLGGAFRAWNFWREVINTSTKFCTSNWDVVSVSGN